MRYISILINSPLSRKIKLSLVWVIYTCLLNIIDIILYSHIKWRWIRNIRCNYSIILIPLERSRSTNCPEANWESILVNFIILFILDASLLPLISRRVLLARTLNRRFPSSFLSASVSIILVVVIITKLHIRPFM